MLGGSVGAVGFNGFNGKAYIYSGQNGVELSALSKTGATGDSLGRGVSIGR